MISGATPIWKNMDYVRSLKLIALKNAIDKPSFEEEWYKIARWYSKTFFTPLHMVDDLPRLDILRAYFSEHYENLEEGELQHELQELLKPEDQLQDSLDKAKDDSSLDELVKQAESKVRTVKAVKAKRAPVKEPSKQDVSKEMLAAIADLGEALTSIKDTAEEPPDQSFGLDFSGLQDL